MKKRKLHRERICVPENKNGLTRVLWKRAFLKISFRSLQVFDEKDVRRARFVGRQKEVRRVGFCLYDESDEC